MKHHSGRFEELDVVAGDRHCGTFAQRIGTALARAERRAEYSAKMKV
jgi:hypothetical protein